MNTNADMTAELKVMTSNFGADESKGPVTISAIGKSGGQQFHGEAYLYSRYYTLNANDAQNKNSNIPRPETKYFYPGFQIGVRFSCHTLALTGAATKCSSSLQPSITNRRRQRCLPCCRSHCGDA